MELIVSDKDFHELQWMFFLKNLRASLIALNIWTSCATLGLSHTLYGPDVSCVVTFGPWKIWQRCKWDLSAKSSPD